MLTWSFSGLSEMSFRLEEVRFLWVMAGLPEKKQKQTLIKVLFSKTQDFVHFINTCR